jgi:phosphatidylserine/phosphatidylglycerophosphate/cardiolipin synthase-like enzyme
MAARFARVTLIAALLGGCAALPPGADFSKSASVVLAHPEETRLGRQLATAAHEHGETSGFRLITVGVEGFLTRAQMIDAAERTLDLQYFIFRGDETGRLLTDALLRAADRGARVRVLIDDGDTIAGAISVINTFRWTRNPSSPTTMSLPAVQSSGNSPPRSMSIGNSRLAIPAEALGRKQRTAAAFFAPADEEAQLLKDLRQRQVRVRILTNSLESTPDLAAQSAYLRYRVPLLEDGMELYEVRSLWGNARGSGQTAKPSRYGNYALHAKLLVFDRRQVFIGSMNFDQRSKRINTEVGLIIDSPELAQQTAIRFEAMAQPENSYALALRPGSAGSSQRLVWHTQEHGKAVEYTREPARSTWQRLKVKLLALLPIAGEL